MYVSRFSIVRFATLWIVPPPNYCTPIRKCADQEIFIGGLRDNLICLLGWGGGVRGLFLVGKSMIFYMLNFPGWGVGTSIHLKPLDPRMQCKLIKK